jgi:transposase
VVIGGIEQKAHFFALDLPHSDASYIRAYPAATAEAWVDGHLHALAFFGRVPLSVLLRQRQMSGDAHPGGWHTQTRPPLQRVSVAYGHRDLWVRGYVD